MAGVGGTQLSKELLGLSGEGGIAAQVRASASGRALPRQEPNQLVGVTSFKLFWQSQANTRRNLVWSKVREEGILLILLFLEGRACPGFMNDATAVIPAERTLARALTKVLEGLPAELMVRVWAERTRALVLGGS